MKRFRKILLLSMMMLLVFALQAQVEVKTNPVAYLFKNFPVKAEYVFSPNWGAELGLGYQLTNWTLDNGERADINRYAASLAVKHYFMPSAKGGDRFYALLYNKYRKYQGSASTTSDRVYATRDALGLALGYKWVSQKQFTVETALGGGRAVYNEIDGQDISMLPFVNLDVYWRLDIGYRF